MGKVAALLQPDGTYLYFVNENGTDFEFNRDKLYEYTSVWIEDPENLGMGYTYIINGEKGDVYYSGTFEEEHFDEENESVIYFGVSNWKEMESIIPGFKATDKVGTKTVPGISLIDELKAYTWLNSLGTNMVSEKVNMVPNELIKQGYGGALLKGYTRSGGIIGGSLVLNDLYDDWHTYSGTRLLKVWGYDLVPLGFGAVGGYFLSYPGAISGSVAGDRAKDYFKDQVPTDRDIKAVKGSRQ